MTKLLVILALVSPALCFVVQPAGQPISTVAPSTSGCSASQVNQITQCYQTYLAGYNISIMNSSLPEYWGFHDVRKQMLLDHGLEIQPYVCSLGNNLKTCLQPFQSSCMSASTYMQMGAFNMTEAGDYWIDLAVTEYMCGPGYAIGNQEFYCMAFCRNAHQPDLDACSATLVKTVMGGGDKCKAEQAMMNCQSKVYQNCCDWNAGVYMCGVNLAGITATDPQSCAGKLSCPNARSMLDMLRVISHTRHF